MRFFRFISLSRIFVACILIISAMPSSAQDLRDWSLPLKGLDLELNLILRPWYAQPHIFKLIKGQKTPELYLFLKEAQGQNLLEPQQPSEEIEKIFRTRTTAHIKECYLGYYKLHNISMSTPWRQAIAWGQFILRIHSDNQVTGWILGNGTSGGTYERHKASKDITGSFLGEINNNSITFNFVTEKGEKPSDGYEIYESLVWNGAHDVLKGTWKGDNKHLSPRNQEGIVHINMHSHPYCVFDIKDAINTFSKDPVKWKEEYILEREKDAINTFSKDSVKWKEEYILEREKTQSLKIDDTKLIIAWNTVKAWEVYQEYLPENLKKEKEEILDFRVTLMHQVHSGEKFDKNGNPLSVPMRFGRRSTLEKYNLSISTGTFFTDGVENEELFKSKLSLIAHEILGHGIFFRYYGKFIEEKSEDLFNKCSNPISLTEEIKSCITRESAQTAIQEGLAVAVEYAVYQHEKKMSIDIETFMKTRYPSEEAAIYRLGVKYLREQKIITEDGKLDFSKINN